MQKQAPSHSFSKWKTVNLLQVYRGPVENLGVSIGMDYAASLLKIAAWLFGTFLGII